MSETWQTKIDALIAYAEQEGIGSDQTEKFLEIIQRIPKRKRDALLSGLMRVVASRAYFDGVNDGIKACHEEL